MANMSNQTPFNANSQEYHKMLIDLIKLRETDYPAFMNKLYEALSGEFKGAIHDSKPKEEKVQAILTMIEHFSEREEYEKCAELKKLVEQL